MAKVDHLCELNRHTKSYFQIPTMRFRQWPVLNVLFLTHKLAHKIRSKDSQHRLTKNGLSNVNKCVRASSMPTLSCCHVELEVSAKFGVLNIVYRIEKHKEQ